MVDGQRGQPAAGPPADHFIDGVFGRVGRLRRDPGVDAERAAPLEGARRINLNQSLGMRGRGRREARHLARRLPPLHAAHVPRQEKREGPREQGEREGEESGGPSAAGPDHVGLFQALCSPDGSRLLCGKCDCGLCATLGHYAQDGNEI